MSKATKKLVNAFMVKMYYKYTFAYVCVSVLTIAQKRNGHKTRSYHHWDSGM